MTGIETTAQSVRSEHQGIVPGCLPEEDGAEGNIRKFTRRLWPQTEIAKAWIAQAEAGKPGAVNEGLEAIARLPRHYLQHPVLGGWHDQFVCADHALVDVIPASSFYPTSLRNRGI